MSFPVPVVLPFNFQSELGTSFGTHLDANFVELADTINSVLANLQLIQRDDGAIRNQTVHANAFTSDALALMAGSSVSSSVDWEPMGAWVTATLYRVGNIVEEGSPATAYACAVQHTSGVFATDYAAGKWVVLSAPRTLISADVTGALGFTPVNKAGDTMTGALVMVTGTKIGGASGMAFEDDLLATQDLITIDRGFYSSYASSLGDITYGYAANVVRTGSNFFTVGVQTSAIGAAATTATMFGGNINAIGLSTFVGPLVGLEIDVGSFNPSNTQNKYGLNLVFSNRAGTNAGEYSYTFPNSGTFSNSGSGVGANQYNRAAVAIQVDSAGRTAASELCGWGRGIRFGEYSLDSEQIAGYPGSRAYPIGIDFSELHYYGGTDPVTSFNLEAAMALRDFQCIWWNRDPATAATTTDKVRSYFNPAIARWVIENGTEKFGVDVVTGAIYVNGAAFGAGASLTGNNVWTAAGSNTFQGAVTLQTNLGFDGNARRIRADFSNATIVNRTLFQTVALNSATDVGVIPNGSGGESAFFMLSDSAAANGQVGRIAISGTQFQINSGVLGGGSYVPITFGVAGVEAMRIDAGAAPGQVMIGATSPTNLGAKLYVNGYIQCSNPVAFSVHRNGVNQSIADSTPTAIAFTTEVFDTASVYNTGTARFTPPDGYYALMGAVSCAAGAGVDQAAIVVAIYKNGAQHKSGNFATMSGAGNTGSHVSCIVQANGTDYFELFVTHSGTGANMIMTGAATDTWFQGYRIG